MRLRGAVPLWTLQVHAERIISKFGMVPDERKQGKVKRPSASTKMTFGAVAKMTSAKAMWRASTAEEECVAFVGHESSDDGVELLSPTRRSD